METELRLTDRPPHMMPDPAAIEAPRRKRRHWHLLFLVLLNLLGLVVGLIYLSIFVPALELMDRTPVSIGYPGLFLLGAFAAWSGRSRPRVADDDITAANRTTLAIFATAMFVGGVYVGLLFLGEATAIMLEFFQQHPPVIESWG